MVAEGEADIAILDYPNFYWDIAAPYGVLLAGGGVAYDKKGQYLAFNGSNTPYMENGICKESPLVAPICSFANRNIQQSLGVIKKNDLGSGYSFTL